MVPYPSTERVGSSSRSDDIESQKSNETTIEEHDFIIRGDEGTIVTIRLSSGYGEGYTWLRNIHADMSLDGNSVGYAFARLIYRNLIRDGFWDNMDRASSVASDIGFELFNRYGVMRQKFISHPIQKGSGAWGHELSNGVLLVIEQVHITESDLVGRGIGGEVLSLILQHAKREVADRKQQYDMQSTSEHDAKQRCNNEWPLHAIARPDYCSLRIEAMLEGKSQEDRLSIRNNAYTKAVGFFQSQGFRRVGASRCFAFSFDSRHRTREISAADDFTPQRAIPGDGEDDAMIADASERFRHYQIAFKYRPESSSNRQPDPIATLQRVEGRLYNPQSAGLAHPPNGLVENSRMSPLAIFHGMSEMYERRRWESTSDLPLHRMAIFLDDAECNVYLRNLRPDQVNDGRVDSHGSTVLHVLACEAKPDSLSWLLLNVPDANKWILARDINGYTPREALEELLETLRTIRPTTRGWRDTSDQFIGYDSAATVCLDALDQFLRQEIFPQPIRLVDMARLKSGCSCGRCLDGFLSPHMSYSLRKQAEIILGTFHESPDLYLNGDAWLDSNHGAVRYLHIADLHRLRTDMTLRRGFVKIFHLAFRCLEEGRVPDVDTIFDQLEAEFLEYTGRYLVQVGYNDGIRAALLYLLERTKQEDDIAGSGKVKDYSPFFGPACRNDREYGFLKYAWRLHQGIAN